MIFLFSTFNSSCCNICHVCFQCKEKLTGVQKLMTEDVNINRALMIACKKAIRKNDCLEGASARTTAASQAKIILCLERAIENSAGTAQRSHSFIIHIYTPVHNVSLLSYACILR